MSVFGPALPEAIQFAARKELYLVHTKMRHVLKKTPYHFLPKEAREIGNTLASKDKCLEVTTRYAWLQDEMINDMELWK